MAVKYKLVQRRDMSTGAAEGAKLWYAQGYITGICSMDELCNEIADRSTATAGDIKLTIDGLVQILSRRLQAGQSVQLGDLGTFRPSVGSVGSKTKEDFHASLIRNPRIVFYPGKQLRETRKMIRVERITDKKEAEEGGEEPGGF